MFENLQNLWAMLSQGAQMPDTSAVAAQMAQLGDPDTLMKPLFSDTKSWSPTYFGEGLAPPAQGGGPLGLNDQLITFDKMLRPQAPVQVPQINLGNSDFMMDGTPRQPGASAGAQTQDRARLTVEQAVQLMGAMPDQKGYIPPAPASPGRPQPFNTQMTTLQPGTLSAQRRPTLGDLIYGGR